MDAVTYVRELRRICHEDSVCTECPLGKFDDCSYADPEEVVKAVEEWSKEHPLVTNGEKFEEVFGDVMSGVVKNLSGNKPAVSLQSLCVLKDWWDAEYKGE